MIYSTNYYTFTNPTQIGEIMSTVIQFPGGTISDPSQDIESIRKALTSVDETSLEVFSEIASIAKLAMRDGSLDEALEFALSKIEKLAMDGMVKINHSALAVGCNF